MVFGFFRLSGAFDSAFQSYRYYFERNFSGYHAHFTADFSLLAAIFHFFQNEKAIDTISRQIFQSIWSISFENAVFDPDFSELSMLFHLKNPF